MSVYNISDLFNIYDIIESTLDDSTGTITCNLGNAITGKTETSSAELWQQCGFASRPSDVLDNATDAAQAIAIARSNQDLIIATRDCRSQDIYGSLKAGESCLYASGDGNGCARILLKADGSINLYTNPNNDKTANGLGVFINAVEDSLTLTTSKGVGIRITNDGIDFLSGGTAGISVTPSSVNIAGSSKISNLQVLGGITVGSGGLNVVGPSIFTSSVTANGLLTISGASSFTGPLSINGVTTIVCPPIAVGQTAIIGKLTAV